MAAGAIEFRRHPKVRGWTRRRAGRQRARSRPGTGAKKPARGGRGSGCCFANGPRFATPLPGVLSRHPRSSQASRPSNEFFEVLEQPAGTILRRLTSAVLHFVLETQDASVTPLCAHVGDQKAESGPGKSIEDGYQAIAARPADRSLPRLAAGMHHAITEMYLLWRLRCHLRTRRS